MTTENLDAGSTEGVNLASLQEQMSEEVNAVRNFAFIGAVVFLAGMVFLLVFDTSSIPLKYRLKKGLNLAATAQQKYERELTDRGRNKHKAVERAIADALHHARHWVACSNFGTFVTDSNGAVVISEVVAGSTAANAGITQGAQVTKVNNSSVASADEYAEVLSKLIAGDKVVLTFKNGQQSTEASFVEAIDKFALIHDIEHYAHNVEHAIEHHWNEEQEPLNSYLFRAHELEQLKKRDELLPEDARLMVAVAKPDGTEDKVPATENDLNLAKKSHEASVDGRLSLRDRKLNNAGTEFRHKYESYEPLVNMIVARFIRDDKTGDIRLANAKDKGANKNLGAKIISAANDYYAFKVETATSLEFKREHQFPAEQKIEDERYKIYAGFMAAKLAEDFGTPQNPKIKGFEGADEGKLKVGKAFYVRHCQHCHGVEGAGDGSTAPFLNPRPRIFTHGIFKFRSNTTPKPTIKDLMHVLQNGLYGSSMPNFKVFASSDVDAVAHYVRFLAIRGEVEFRVHKQMIEAQELIIDDPDENPLELLQESYEESKEMVYEGWGATEEAVVAPEGEMVDLSDPEAVAEAVEKGEKLFRANCASCHGYEGKGGGEQSDGMYDSWGHPVQPRNLTQGIYRAGNRPIDLYWRISCGITGAGMPAFNNWPPEDKWAVVTYVKNLANRPDASNGK